MGTLRKTFATDQALGYLYLTTSRVDASGIRANPTALDLVSFRAQGSWGYPRCMGTATL